MVVAPLRVAVIGLGAGADHIMLPAVTRAAGARLVAACDIDAGRRARAAALWGIKRLYDDPAAMLMAERPDIVAVATPPLTHRELCLLALEHGCHVFCEKPFVPSVAEADEIIAAARRCNRQIAVNSQYYRMPIYQEVLRQLDGGAAGQLFHADAWQHMHLLPAEEGGWKQALAPRRVLLEFGTHAIDLMCRFFAAAYSSDAPGNRIAVPLAVTARMAKVRAVDADVCIDVRLDFPGDRFAGISFNRVSHAPLRYYEMRLDCENLALRVSLGGLARLDLGWNSELKRPQVRFSFTRGGELRQERRGGSRVLATQPGSAYGDAAALHFGLFVEAARTGQSLEPGIEYARDILRVLLSCYESAEDGGKLVTL